MMKRMCLNYDHVMCNPLILACLPNCLLTHVLAVLWVSMMVGYLKGYTSGETAAAFALEAFQLCFVTNLALGCFNCSVSQQSNINFQCSDGYCWQLSCSRPARQIVRKGELT
jgi:hypothetical protein